MFCVVGCLLGICCVAVSVVVVTVVNATGSEFLPRKEEIKPIRFVIVIIVWLHIIDVVVTRKTKFCYR